MFCSQCAHKLTPTDVYCPKCAKPIASFNFDPGQIPQVEYIGDNETETVVRPTPTKPTARRRSESPWWYVGGTAAGAIVILAGSVAFLAFAVLAPKYFNRPMPPENVDRVSAATPAPAETPRPTETPKPATPRPTPTTPEVNAMHSEIEEHERQQRAANTAALDADNRSRGEEARQRGGCHTGPNGASYVQTNGLGGWIRSHEPVRVVQLVDGNNAWVVFLRMNREQVLMATADINCY